MGTIKCLSQRHIRGPYGQLLLLLKLIIAIGLSICPLQALPAEANACSGDYPRVFKGENKVSLKFVYDFNISAVFKNTFLLKKQFFCCK